MGRVELLVDSQKMCKERIILRYRESCRGVETVMVARMPVTFNLWDLFRDENSCWIVAVVRSALWAVIRWLGHLIGSNGEIEAFLWRGFWRGQLFVVQRERVVEGGPRGSKGDARGCCGEVAFPLERRRCRLRSRIALMGRGRTAVRGACCTVIFGANEGCDRCDASMVDCTTVAG